MKNTTSAVEPEYNSINDFAEFLIETDQTEYTSFDVGRLFTFTRVSMKEIRQALDSYGFQYRQLQRAQFGRPEFRRAA